MSEDPPTLENLDYRLRKLDLQLSQVELDAKKRENEIADKVKAAESSEWYKNPLVLSIIAAAVALSGNIYVTWSNNRSARELERLHMQSSLIFEAIKTNGDTDAACKNLVFFVRLGLLENAHDTILGTCPKDTKGVPTLAANTVPGTPQNFLNILVRDERNMPIGFATVHVEDDLGNTDNCKTLFDGECKLPPLPKGDAIRIEVSKPGYETTKTQANWTGSPIVVVLHSR